MPRDDEPAAVPSAFHLLLESTVAHLRDLQARGVRFVRIEPETLAALAAASASPPASSRVLPGPLPRTEDARPAPALVAPAVSVPAPAAGPRAASEDKVQALESLRGRALVCQKCAHLVRTRSQVVFGVGDVHAELMFVGEAPGADEDRLGEPFVGRAGQLLTKMILAMGFSRETVYIANVLKCRPDMPAGSRGNRPPTQEEMDTCKPYLLSQIDIIQPRVIVALGATAVAGLLGQKTPISAMRGRWHEFRRIPLLATFHPSYLLRSEDAPDRGHSEKRKAWEDMLLVLDRLGRPITDRMRGYFLKPGPESRG